MESHDKNLTEQESFDMISRMIRSAQHDIEDNSFYYLTWGWLVFIASSLHYALMQSGYEMPYITWGILMPLGAIITIVYSIRAKRNKKVKTYVDDVMKFVIIAFIASLFIVLLFMSKIGAATYPIVMIIYGIWLFISGGILKFQPLITGGIINWGLAIAALFVGFDIQLLLLAAAVLLGYIIPGHMLKARFKNQNSATEIA